MANYTKTQHNTIARALNIISEHHKPGGEELTNPAATVDFLRLFYADKHDREHFTLIFLNSNHNILAAEILFSGTLDGAAVYPREVIKRALHHNAAAVILAHNHPSGNASPSTADRRITERLKDAFGTIDIHVLDHIIITPGADYTSFAREGLL